MIEHEDDSTPIDDRLARIEAAVENIARAIAPMVKAWERFGPLLEKRLGNPAARWKAGK